MCKAQPMQSWHELMHAVKQRNYSYYVNLSQKSEPYLSCNLQVTVMDNVYEGIVII